MSDENKVDLELDLKGLLCPLPMVKVSQNIGNVPVGGVIRAVATDPGAMADIPRVGEVDRQRGPLRREGRQ